MRPHAAWLVLPVVAILFFGDARAQDATSEALKARTVENFILFQASEIDGVFTIEYGVDTAEHFRSFSAEPFDTSFLAKEQIHLRFKAFNPLSMIVAYKVEEFDDENFKALEQLLSGLKTMATAMAGLSAQHGMIESELKMLESRAKLQGIALTDYQTCSGARELMRSVHVLHLQDFSDPPVSIEEVTRWQRDAIGLPGVIETDRHIKEKIDDINGIDKRLQSESDALANESFLQVANAHAAKPPVKGGNTQLREQCYEELARSKALAAGVSYAYGELGSALEEILQSLKKLRQVLTTFLKEGDWAEDKNGIKNDRIVGREHPKRSKGLKITLDVTRRQLEVDGTKIDFKVQDNTSTTIRLRKYRLVVPEIGAGFLWSDLTIPKYGTETDGGTTTVVRTGAERLGTEVTLVANFPFRVGRHSFVYPGFQIGVGTGKEYPSLLGGILLRFTAPQHLALSAGWITTWVEDLDKLNVGDTIGGPSDLEADLRRTRVSDTYIAILYNWSPGNQGE